MTASVFDALRARWRDSYDPALGRAFTNALDFGHGAQTARAEAARRPDLTPQGQAMAVRAHLVRNGVHSELRRYAEQIAQTEANLKARREALAKPAPSPERREDLTEMRMHLRAMDPAARLGLAMSDPLAAEAVLTAPSPALVGHFLPEHREQVAEHYLRTTQADALAALEEAEEALALTRAAHQTALVSISSNGGFKDDRALAGWLETGRDPDAT